MLELGLCSGCAMQRNLEAMLQQCIRTDPNCQPEALQQLLIDKVETLVSEGDESENEVVIRAGAETTL